jgi:hypothetical protein
VFLSPNIAIGVYGGLYVMICCLFHLLFGWLLNDMEVKTTVIGKWMSIICQKIHNLELDFVN